MTTRLSLLLVAVPGILACGTPAGRATNDPGGLHDGGSDAADEGTPVPPSNGDRDAGTEADVTPTSPDAALAADPVGNRFGINISNASDYGAEKAFADAMKTARDYTVVGDSKTPVATDGEGWPSADAQVVVWAGATGMNGTYRLSFTGKADASMQLVAGAVENVAYSASTGTTTADVRVTDAGQSTLVLSFTNTVSGVKNIRLMRPTAPGSGQPYAGDVVWTAPFLRALAPFQAIRFMDFTATNWNQSVDWADRVLPSSASYTRYKPNYGWEGTGAPWETVIALANAAHKDAWICVPALATDDYVRALAALFRNGDMVGGIIYPGLDPGLRIYVEYANEVWNSAFAALKQNHDLAQTEAATGVSPISFDGETDPWTLTWRRTAWRAVEQGLLFAKVFGADQLMTRVRPVFEWQQDDGQSTGSTGLSFLDAFFAQARPAYGFPVVYPVSHYIYGGGGSAYYNPENASDTLSIDGIWTSSTFSESAWAKPLASDFDLTTFAGIKRVAYEGGPSMDKTGHSEAVKSQAWDDARMTRLVEGHHDEWTGYGGDLLMYFDLAPSVDDYQWAFLHEITTLTTAKYSAIAQLGSAPRAPLTYPSVVPATLVNANVRRPSWKTGTTIGDGEWLSYSVRTPSDANFNVRVNFTQASGTLGLFVDGAALGQESVSGDGMSHIYPVRLAAGAHSVRPASSAGSTRVVNVQISTSP